MIKKAWIKIDEENNITGFCRDVNGSPCIINDPDFKYLINELPDDFLNYKFDSKKSEIIFDPALKDKNEKIKKTHSLISEKLVKMAIEELKKEGFNFNEKGELI